MSEGEDPELLPMWQLEEAVTRLGIETLLMNLEVICNARVKKDPEHAAYWAVRGHQLGSIVYPPNVMFGSLQGPLSRRLKDFLKEE